ncbi:MAG TPA: DNA methyltransferase, partial [Isosphaeraceae bacterium]|nr:DNA methyltransferase [Isosphaeraceae bacterium]
MNLRTLLEAINDRNIVSGLTHDIYRYPARFSPVFARAAIELFTAPGDTVFDPFMGGSTTLVEALALGRHAIGTDINQLSVFLARVKTLLLSDPEIDMLRVWADNMVPDLSPRKPVVRHTVWQDMGYQDNLPWRFRKLAEQALNNAQILLEGGVLLAARCVVLKTVQWAVDCKKALPTASEFRTKIVADADAVADGLRALRQQVEALGARRPTVEAHYCAADAIGRIRSSVLRRRPPKLVVTSPPYAGVHVLYHRWQVLGRRETAAPYWITESNDGRGASFYTFCDRRRQDHDEKYFARLLACFTAVREVVRDDCVIAQLVGFAQPSEQLPLYLDAMRDAGFADFDFRRFGHRPAEAVFWRAVPNRKWYTRI